MKIQKLAIHNIASIENAEIDFTVRPLSDSDVFLITGVTGSGKSTILDAICLALYGTTPRLENTLMEGAVDVAGKEVQLDNPAQLLRKTTGEGYVRLSFEGTDGVPYEAEWSVARARGKADGRLQPRKWSLIDLHSGTTYTKENEIKTGIGKAVGLTFDQFCRTTMLAQGQFTRFLDSKDEEKAEILEMITGADIYSKIGAKVFEITRDKEAAYKEAKDALLGITLLTEEQKDGKRSDIESRKGTVSSLSAEMGKARMKADWLDREGELNAEKGKAGKALSAAEEATRTEAFLAEGALVKAYRETVQVRGSLGVYYRQEADAAEARRKIDRLFEKYQTVRSGQRWLLEQRRSLGGILAEVGKAIDKDAPIASVIGNAQTLYSQLDIVEAGVPAISSLETGIGEQEVSVRDVLTPAWEKASAAAGEAGRKRTETQAALKSAENALAAADLPAKSWLFTELVANQGRITLAKERIETYKRACKSREEEQKAITAKEQETGGAETARAALYGEVCELKAAMEVAKRTYEAESTASLNVVGEMRRKLQAGDFCPVCMQEIKTALPTEADVEARLRPIEAAYRAALDAFEKKKADLGRLDAGIQAERRRLDERKRALASDTTLSTLYASLQEALNMCGAGQYDPGTEYRLGVLAEQVRQRKDAVEAQVKAGTELEQKVKSARTDDAKALLAFEAARDAGTKAGDDLKAAVAAIEKDKAVLTAQRKAVQGAALQIDGIVKGTSWAARWRNAFVAFRQEVESAVAAHYELVERKGRLEEDLRGIDLEAEAVGRALQEVERMVPSWKESPLGEMREVRDLSVEAASLKDSLLVETRNFAAADASARENWAKVAAFLSSDPGFTVEFLDGLSRYTDAAIEAYDRHQKSVLESVMTARGALASIEHQIRDHAGKRPGIEEGETVEALRIRQGECNAGILALTSEISLIEAELKADALNQERSGKLAEKADALRAERDKWSRLNEMIGDNTGKKFRKIAQSYVLGSLVSAANHYMKELSDRYTLEVIPGTFVILLEDAYQGFEKRPACTSSGGEGFLVSLALALALSDIGDSLSVDTLFIDEGFGTLSGEPLQNAINTLKTLRKKAGRHVGIISHIEEVQEKIPVKIVLEQDNRTASSRVKVLPIL